MPREIYNVFFTQGVDTKTDGKSLPPGKLEVAENVVFTKQTSIAKRNGYTHLSKETTAGGSITSATALGVRDDELLLFSENQLYSYADGSSSWDLRGPCYSVGVDQKTVAYSTSEQSHPDHANTGGITVYAWEDARGGVWYAVLDSTTGALLVADTQISANGSKPRCLAFNGYINIFYLDETGGTAYVKNQRISSASPSSSGSPITIVDDLDTTNPNYDVDNYSTYGVLAYYNDSGDIGIGFVARNGQLGSPGNGGYPSLTSFTGVADGAICVRSRPDGDYFAVLYVEAGVTIDVQAVDHTLTASGASTFSTDASDTTSTTVTMTFINNTDTKYDGTACVFWEVPATDLWNHYVTAQTAHLEIVGGAVAVDTYTWRHAGLASHAFLDDDQVYVNLVHDSPQQATYFCARHDGHLISKHLYGVAGGVRTNGALPGVHASGRNHTWVGSFKNRATVEEDVASVYSETGIKAITLDFAAGPRTVQLGHSTYSTGGYLSVYDGGAPVESGFHLVPENVSATASTTASGALTTASTYSYEVQWEWYTATGERELSATISGVQVSTAGGADTVTLTVPTLSLTGKAPGTRNGVRLAVNRTEGDGADNYYRVDDPSAPTWNNPSVDTITFIDTLSDTTMLTRELNYADVEFSHIAPPAAEIATGTKQRIFLAGVENPHQVHYSKIHRWDNAVAFAAELADGVDQEGGVITALAPLDDKLIIFKKHRILALAGNGPDNAGISGDTFSPAQLITSDVGCSNQASIVSLSIGVMFQSTKGIYLLSRDLQVTYLGAPVEGFNNQTITAATLLPDKNMVIFLCSSGDTLVYDYHFNQWSTFTNHAGVDATVWNDSYCYVTSGGLVKQEDDSYLDGSSPIKMVLQTGWIAFGQPQTMGSLRRCYLLGEYVSPHTLVWKTAFNYADHFAQTKTWDPDEVLNVDIFGSGTCIGDTTTFGSGSGVFGGSGSTVYQPHYRPRKSKVQAVKFRFEDKPDQDSPGASFELNNLALEFNVKGIPFKRGDINRAD